MTNRAIVIFPRFNNSHLIEEIRKKHDPLYGFIGPHITLVFPFQSELTKEEIVQHLEERLMDVRPFELIAKGITGAGDGYVFLDVKKGNDNIIELHDKLYSGILKPHHNRFIPYTPHITIGRLEGEIHYKGVVEELLDFDVEFKTIVDQITVEVIDNEKSILEYEYKI